MTLRAEDVPPETKRLILYKVKEEIGCTQYTNLVDTFGEDRLFEMVVSQTVSSADRPSTVTSAARSGVRKDKRVNPLRAAFGTWTDHFLTLFFPLLFALWLLYLVAAGLAYIIESLQPESPFVRRASFRERFSKSKNEIANGCFPWVVLPLTVIITVLFGETGLVFVALLVTSYCLLVVYYALRGLIAVHPKTTVISVTLSAVVLLLSIGYFLGWIRPAIEVEALQWWQ